MGQSKCSFLLVLSTNIVYSPSLAQKYVITLTFSECIPIPYIQSKDIFFSCYIMMVGNVDNQKIELLNKNNYCYAKKFPLIFLQ